MTAPRPVMLLANLHQVGGTQRQCLRLCRALTDAGSVPRVLSPHPVHSELSFEAQGTVVIRAHSPLAQALRKSRDQLTRAVRARTAAPAPSGNGAQPGSRRRPSLLFQRLPNRLDEAQLLKSLAAQRSEFEVLHLHGVYWLPMLHLARRAAEVLNRPLVVKITNEAARTWELLERNPESIADLARADAIVTLSRDGQRFFARKFPAARVVLIPNGVEIPPLDATNRPTDGSLVYVGWLKAQKGVDVLLRAWALLPARLERLLLIGDGPERPAIERLVQQLKLQDRVELLGMRKDVAQFLGRAKAFVLPSRWEGMPNALLEAMAYGRACVATQIAGSMDVVEHNTTGLLVPPDDPQALASALAQVLDSPQERARLGTAARNTAIEHFSLSSVASQTLKLYADIVAARRAGSSTFSASL